MEGKVLRFLGDLGPAERALLVDEEGLDDALVAEGVVAVGGDGAVENLVADCALVVLFDVLLGLYLRVLLKRLFRL